MTDYAAGVLPAMPDANGPNPQKVRFYSEVAAAFEFLALFYSLPMKDQEELNTTIRGFATTSAIEAQKTKGQKR